MLFINGKEYISDIKFTTKEDVASLLNLSTSEFYLLHNGKIINDLPSLQSLRVDVILRLKGGKGGFGSMLRAIGAQIEKTTNREACRDLSGRRLRDINEEKRLKAWISQQADREKETEDRRKKKLERLYQKPKHEFKDESYEKERSEFTDRVVDAFEHGLSKEKGKRKSSENTTIQKTKKPKLWLGSDEELSSSDEDEQNDAGPSTKVDNISENKIDNVVNLSDTSNEDKSEEIQDEKISKNSEVSEEKEEVK